MIRFRGHFPKGGYDIHDGHTNQFSIRNNHRFERLDNSFEISDGVTLPVGEYRFSDLRFGAQSAAQRPVSGRIGYTLGDF